MQPGEHSRFQRCYPEFKVLEDDKVHELLSFSLSSCRDVLVVTIETEMAAAFPVCVMDVQRIVTRGQADVW